MVATGYGWMALTAVGSERAARTRHWADGAGVHWGEANADAGVAVWDRDGVAGESPHLEHDF
eukprot:11144581-Prorocentrum_lima.AAC.1